MGVKKCCERCERYICFNYPMNHGVCCKTMTVVHGASWCENYVLDPRLRRKRGAQNGKTDSSTESNR